MRTAFLFFVLMASAAQAQQPSGSDWKRVQQTAPGTLLRIASGRHPSICNSSPLTTIRSPAPARITSYSSRSPSDF